MKVRVVRYSGSDNYFIQKTMDNRIPLDDYGWITLNRYDYDNKTNRSAFDSELEAIEFAKRIESGELTELPKINIIWETSNKY